jgi:protein translocase SecG subunit
MKEALYIAQILISVILVSLILMQARGTGFGRSSVLGGSTSFSRRGLEKLVFRATFVFAFLFLAASILQLVF